jgi:DNA-binding CsgD family transcriptional regulator
LGFGVLVFDSAFQLVFADEVARRIVARLAAGPAPRDIARSVLEGCSPAPEVVVTLPLRGGGFATLRVLRVVQRDGATQGIVVMRPIGIGSDEHFAAEAERAGFTLREREIASLVTRGLSNKEIAARLSLSPVTVKLHLRATFKKACVDGRGTLSAKLLGLTA